MIPDERSQISAWQIPERYRAAVKHNSRGECPAPAGFRCENLDRPGLHPGRPSGGGRRSWSVTFRRLQLERLRPFVIRQKFLQSQCLVLAQNNFRLQVCLVDLADEFPASAARRQDIELAVSLIS